MLAKDILKLIDAGFTKDEIFSLEVSLSDRAGSETTTPEPEANPAPVQEPETEPQQTAGVTLSDEQFTKLLQQLNRNGASLDVPPDADMSTKLGNHFKDILIGK